MLARRRQLFYRLLTEAEALEVTKIYSIAGLLQRQERVMLERPFRSLHHTISSKRAYRWRQCAAAWGSDIEPSWCFIFR